MKNVTALFLAGFLIFGLASLSFAAEKTSTRKVQKKTPVKPPAKKTEKKIAVVAVVSTSEPVSNKFVKAGLMGGAFRFDGGLKRAINNKLDLAVEAGFGFGNNYYLISAGGAALYKLGQGPFVGLGIDYSYFSKYVLDAPGLSTINKGGALGFSLLAGVNRGRWLAQIAYNNRWGLAAELGYRF